MNTRVEHRELARHILVTMQPLLLVALACAPGGCSDDKASGADAATDAVANDGAVATDGGDAQVSPDSGQPSDPCGALQVDEGAEASGFVGERFRWNDSHCSPRSALMIRNDVADPSGHWGGYLREYRYRLSDDSERVCVGSSQTHPGWGYTVNHYGNTSASSRNYAGTWELTFSGRHHALYRYHWTVPVDGYDVDMVVQWFFATGRDHPVWAISYDASAAPADAISADTRSPYGDIQWDGGAGADVDGVGWGDHYHFYSLGSPITMASGWDYTTPNSIPYVLMWTATANAEMGAVQTQSMAQHDAGGYWFYSEWGNRNETGPMPEDWNWTYQLNQYELPWGSTSKRLAWGSNYGAVGETAYNAYGDGSTLSGYPYQSYAVYMVLDEFNREPTLYQAAQVQAAMDTTVSVSTGTLLTQGPAGLERPDTATYDPPGYNPVTSTFELSADGNAAELSLNVGATALPNPVLVIHGYTASTPPAQVTADGVDLVADTDYYASVDTARERLWLTLVGHFTASTTIAVQ